MSGVICLELYVWGYMSGAMRLELCVWSYAFETMMYLNFGHA